MRFPLARPWVVLLALTLIAGCGDDDSSGRRSAATPTASPSASPTTTLTPTSSASPSPTITRTSTTPPSASPTVTLTPTLTSSPTASVEQNPILGAEFSVAFADGVLTLKRGEQRLQAWPLGAFQFGLVDLLEEAQNYDPYPIVAGIPLLRRPRNLRWVGATSAHVSQADADSFTLALELAEGKRATLSIRQQAAGRFEARFLPLDGGPPVAFFRLRPRVDASEAFYGLGEYFDSVNHRGRIRAMQLEIDSSIESLNNEAHVPIPFVIGTRAWGLFVESPYPAAFDVADAEDDVVEATVGTGLASPEGLLFHLFAAPHPLDVTKHYYEVTGYPILPARWALGPLVWRDENRDQAQVEDDLATMRDLDLATTAIWIDRPYASGVNSFDFKPSQFPDPPRMIQLAHDLGFRMSLWHTPYVDRDDPATSDLQQQAVAGGYLPLRTALALNEWGVPLDFTDPQAFSWWQDLLRRYTDMGIEGFKLDYGEDVVPGIAGTRTIWEFEDGSDERTMHSRYQLFYHRAYAELLPPDGGFLLCRHATYGGQRYASVIWPGDLDADMSKHREVVTDGDETYVAVGGLPASLIAGLTLGPSGFPFYGSDTGGYRHSPPDKETFTRWFEQTALSSVMQIGTSSSDVAWEFTEENGFDEEMLGWYREYTRLHLRLFPYEWTYAQRLLSDGRPIQRALGLAYPDLGLHPDDTYLFGDDLLVAPVVERGARQRQVMLPPGTWLDWWTGEPQEGNRTITVEAPLGVLPLFLRAGGIVPLLRPTIDTISPTTDPERVDSYATTPGVLYVRVAVGPDSSFELFDGAEISQETSESGVTLQTRDGTEFKHGFVFELMGIGDTIDAVQSDGETLTELPDAGAFEESLGGWFRDAERGVLWIKVSAGQHRIEID